MPKPKMHWSGRSNGCKNMVKYIRFLKRTKNAYCEAPRNHAITQPQRGEEKKQSNTTANQPTNLLPANIFGRSNSPHFLTHTPSSRSSNSKAHAHAHAHATTRDNKQIWRTTKKKKRRTKRNNKSELLSYSFLPHPFPPLCLCLCLSLSLLPSLSLPTSSSSLSLIFYKPNQITSTVPFHTHKQLYSSFTLLGNGGGK